MKFPDRAAAGRALAGRLAERLCRTLPSDPTASLPISRSGSTSDPGEDPLEAPPPYAVLSVGDESSDVARAIADSLSVPLGIMGAAHLPLPWRPRLPYGAITDDNHHHLDAEVVADHSLGAREIAAQAKALLPSLRRHRGARPGIDPLEGHTTIVVQDAVAWGYRALAVVEAARAAGAKAVIVATPVAARDVAARFVEAGLIFVALHLADGPVFHTAQFYEDAPLP